jgi:hypothetical protein
MKIIAACFLMISAAGLASANENMDFPTAGLKRLYAVTDTGALRVSGASKNSITLEISDNDPAKCVVTTKVEGDTLRLTAENLPRKVKKTWGNLFGLIQHGSSRTNYKASFTVTAPRAIPLELHSSMGGVNVKGLTGDLKVEAGMGHVSGSVCAIQRPTFS